MFGYDYVYIWLSIWFLSCLFVPHVQEHVSGWQVYVPRNKDDQALATIKDVSILDVEMDDEGLNEHAKYPSSELRDDPKLKLWW